jgi:hypothetical protein
LNGRKTLHLWKRKQIKRKKRKKNTPTIINRHWGNKKIEPKKVGMKGGKNYTLCKETPKKKGTKEKKKKTSRNIKNNGGEKEWNH